MKKNALFIPLLFIYVNLLSQTRWAHVTLDSNGIEKTGVISGTGELLVPTKYDMVIGHNGFYFVKQNNLWGCYYNHENIIPVIYEDIGCKISEQLVRVKQQGKWGFVNLYNKVIIDFKYDFACNFDEGKAYCIVGDKRVFIDKQGKVLTSTDEKKEFCWEDIDTTVSVVSQFRDSTLIIKESNKKFGVLELKTNKVIIPFEYDEIGEYFKNTILVRKDNNWGAYFDDGRLITLPKYKSIGIFWSN